MEFTGIALASGLLLTAGSVLAWWMKRSNTPRKFRTVSLDQLLYPTPAAPRSPSWDGTSRRIWGGYEWDQFDSDPRDLLDR